MMSFNLEGFRRNKHYLSFLLSQHKPRILFLQEIWLPYCDQSSLNQLHPDYTFEISTPDMFTHPEDLLVKPAHVWHGVAVGWRSDIGASIAPLQSTCDRISGVRMTLEDSSLLLLSFYAPTSGQDEDFLESICNLADYLLQHFSPNDKIIIGTDSNCSTKSTQRRQEAWKNFCERFQLSCYLPPRPSFHHHNGQSESFLDLFAASTSLQLQNVLQHCTLENPLNLSSHDPIETTVSVQLDISSKVSKYSHTYEVFNRQRIAWDHSRLPDYHRLSSLALSDALNYWNTPECLPHLSSLVSRLLVKSASLVFDSSSTSHNLGPKKPSLKIRQAQNDLKRKFNAWKRAGKPTSKTDPSRSGYREARSNLQRVSRYEETLKKVKENNFLMHLDQRNQSKIYSAMKKSRGNISTNMTPVLHTPVGTYYGEDVLEGFAADTEYLGKSNESKQHFDQDFYKLCKLDNLYIFDFAADEPVPIPPMTISQLNKILNSKMKAGKACDVYQVTVEHLRHCGDQAKQHILTLINRILHDIYYLSCPQIKLGLGTPIQKKKKPLSKSNSYRRITVTPIIGAIIDYYLDPPSEALFRKSQSPDQLGFTAGISYLLAALQRGECQRWAIDQKQTCFGVSLDGEAAFPSVEREIQVRELYTIGERGDLLNYSRNTYKNTACHMKLKDKISRKVVEDKGNR